MSGTYAGFQIAGGTRHFLITYADAGDADEIERANAILASCEADLATLEQWFSCDYDTAPYVIWVQVLKGSPGAGAGNYGYTTGESPIIQISGTAPQQGVYVLAGAVAQMLFVAELAEVLMGFTSYGWNAGNSAGEGLSRVAAAELHTAGAYASTFGLRAPWANAWLNSDPRPDWVSNSEGTDTDSTSFGCAVLFLYYLRYQLGYSYAAIVSAGGSTLAQTYARLTGQPASNAFGALTSLLNQHVPAGTPFQLSTDEIFRLSSPPTVACVFNAYSVGTPVFQGTTTFTAAVCKSPPAQYSFETFSNVTEIDFSATAFGLVDGSFSWLINGIQLAQPAQPGGSTGQLFTSVPVTITDIAPPVSGDNPSPFQAELGLTYVVESLGRTKSRLLIRNTDSPGNCSLTISVSAQEALVNQPAGQTTTTADMTTLSYTLSASYWAALYPCLVKPVSEASAALAAIADSVIILRNTPDPSPDQIIGVVAVMNSYLAAVEQVSSGAIGQRAAAAAVISAAQRPVREPGITARPGVDGGAAVLSAGPQTVRLRTGAPGGTAAARGPAAPGAAKRPGGPTDGPAGATDG